MTRYEIIKTTIRKRRLLLAGAVARQGKERLPGRNARDDSWREEPETWRAQYKTSHIYVEPKTLRSSEPPKDHNGTPRLGNWS